MAELRQDVATGRWVVVATERSMRPSDFVMIPALKHPVAVDCPFCPGNESMTPPELYAVRPGGSRSDTPGWLVRVVPNKFPAFHPGGDAPPSKRFFPRRPAEGSHEVIIHSPSHEETLATMDHEPLTLVLRVYRERFVRNSGLPLVHYVHVIVNHKMEAGASLEHPHSQLFGMPFVPPLIRTELEGAASFREERGSCVYCAMAAEESEAGRRVVAENGGFIAIAPFASRLPFEVRIIPKRHSESFSFCDDGELDGFAAMLSDVLGRIRDRLNDPPYNLYIHTAPCDGGEYGYYHWHLELVPKLTVPGAFELGTSVMINVTTPEAAALHLREG